MRRFKLFRIHDETGISGIGYVAEGVEMTSGQCMMQWLTEYASIAIYPSFNHVVQIHGHNGKTIIEWIDERD